jgi:hypothetical protein
MGSRAEIAAVTRALLALITSVVELDEALLALAPPQNERFLDHIKASHEARNKCLEEIKLLLDIMEKPGD